jgi:hypothetical protein
MKVLIFTDSRGEHKKSFNDKDIFTDKIKYFFEEKNIYCDLMLCPFSWTSTLEFIQCIEENILNPNDYQLIILYTGVVEYSPRPISNYKKCYEEHNDKIDLYNLLNNKRQVKIFNNKKIFMEKFINKKLIELNSEYLLEYNKEKTKSLISLDINKNVIIPYLQKFNDKLIFINSNRISNNWEGNYININPLGRPKNINIIEDFSRQTLNKFKYYVNLLEWDDNDIKKFTVDNMHLTYEGSEYIYKKLIEIITKNNLIT